MPQAAGLTRLANWPAETAQPRKIALLRSRLPPVRRGAKLSDCCNPRRKGCWPRGFQGRYFHRRCHHFSRPIARGFCQNDRSVTTAVTTRPNSNATTRQSNTYFARDKFRRVRLVGPDQRCFGPDQWCFGTSGTSGRQFMAAQKTPKRNAAVNVILVTQVARAPTLAATRSSSQPPGIITTLIRT